MRDIYDPPPAPIPFQTPRAERFEWRTGDLAFPIAAGLPLSIAAAWAWSIEPTLSALLLIGGPLVVLESWMTAVSFFQRHPATSRRSRWLIFIAALAPWLVGLGMATALMLGLFSLFDRLGS